MKLTPIQITLLLHKAQANEIARRAEGKPPIKVGIRLLGPGSGRIAPGLKGEVGAEHDDDKFDIFVPEADALAWLQKNGVTWRGPVLDAAAGLSKDGKPQGENGA